jgi:hypothetical protein
LINYNGVSKFPKFHLFVYCKLQNSGQPQFLHVERNLVLNTILKYCCSELAKFYLVGSGWFDFGLNLSHPCLIPNNTAMHGVHCSMASTISALKTVEGLKFKRQQQAAKQGLCQKVAALTKCQNL